MFHTRGQATNRTPAAAASATDRPRSILLVLALLAALGAPLAAAAPVGAQAAARLELTPAKALTDVKKPVRYTAEFVDANGRSDVTSRTTLQATGPAPCHQDHDKLSCDDNGSFEVTGILYDPEITSEPVVLEVVNPGVAPALGPPPPDSPPNREVRVRGHTGSCNQDGTLSSTELKVDQQITGIFTATIRIPLGTFPGIYPLSLDVPCDGKPQGATVQITISNRPPDAVNDVARATPGGSVRIPVTDNDTDPDGEDGYKSALEADPPTAGTADPAGQVIVYTPGPGFVDRDQFTYRNCDVVDAAGKTDCGQATVVVTRENPVPKADQASIKQGKEVPILVTENDTSPDPAKLQVRTDPKHGTAVVKEPRDGHIVYTPEKGFADEDTFEYDYCEGVVFGPNVAAPDACPFATVTVTVEPGPPEPEAVDDPNERTEQDKQVDIDVMSNDGHPVAARLQVLPEPAPQGTAVAQANGVIRYTPEPGATGKDSFQYDYCKPVINLTARAACAPATVTVVIRPPVEITKVDPNPTPPNKEVVVEGTTGFCQEGTLTLRIPPDKDVPVAVTANQDGAFTARLKIPEGTFVGPYGLVLRVDCDGQTQEVQEKLVVANKVPDAVDDLASTPRDTPVTIPVTGNDTDPDGEDGYKTSLEASQPANGMTEVSGDRISYTPKPGFTGDDPFTYRLCDIVDANGKRDCDTATVTVTVVGRRQPVPVDDPDETTIQDQPVVIQVMKNDRDPDASLLQVKPPARPGAKAEEQPGGTVRYTPEAGFTGTDTFTYDYCGGSVDVTAARAACPSATVTVTVTDTPVISSVEPASTSPGKPVQVVGNTGSCNRAGTLTFSGAADLRMSVTGDQSGGFAATITVPDGTFPRPYRLRLDVDCKGQVQRAEAELTVANQAPVAVDDEVTVSPDAPTSIDVTGNDRDPDDPDTYRTIVAVTSPPDTGTAEARPDQSILYTPGEGFVGTDRFTYGLCDDVLNAAGQADCGTATVTVRTSPVACAPSGRDNPSLRVEPERGSGGTRLHITAAVDRRLATCQLRLLLGGTTLAPDVNVGDDGSISADREVPPGLKSGPNRMQLATLTADTLAEAPFEVVGRPPPPLLPPWLVKILLSAGALAAGFLARAVFRKWRKLGEDGEKDRLVGQPEDLRAEPHTRPVEVTVEPVLDNTQTLAVRLEPYPDPGIQTIQTMEEVTR